MSEKEDEFVLYRIFVEDQGLRSGRIAFSDEEIAELCGVRLEHVREYIEQDVKAGMFVENQQKSVYYLTLLGLSVLYKKRRHFLNDPTLPGVE